MATIDAEHKLVSDDVNNLVAERLREEISGMDMENTSN
jgi:hypothetical protein